ncbi:hypothetical protein [Marinifilum caeruleilacunae]|uniref:Uncharacterized protein n=1 Tax=Marinifilum caeruleilacunae TaxID=2499076 RepID=A0ABX1WW62_9BACT|nr:hypothetical protein [Marinifilum caeruleilacunae]NOU60342.1 hypothetical protein [Marinifilum caeruleilacunae]
MKQKLSSLTMVIIFMSAVLGSCTSCSKEDDPTPEVEACDFSTLTISKTETYGFDSNFSEHFTQSLRWESENADIKLVNEKGQLRADSNNTSQALEAWKLYKVQMPYNKSWEISVDVHIPLYWNSNGGKDAQVGAGIFVGKPVSSGQSSKVYECNMAAINGGERFVQAQLIANRLGEDPINVQYTALKQSKELASLKIRFCSSHKKLSLFIDNTIVGEGKQIDAKGLDNWKLSDSDRMDVGIMGFAENTVITSNQPVLDNFSYTIY